MLRIVALAALAAAVLSFPARAQASRPGYALILDGVAVGRVAKVVGGDVTGDVVSERTADGRVFKHLENVHTNDFVVTVALSGASKPIWEWIEGWLQRNDQRKDGSITDVGDFNRDVRYTRHFTGALLTEIGFPSDDGAAKDPSGKDPAYVNLKFTPQLVSRKPQTRAEAKLVAALPDDLPALRAFLCLNGIPCTPLTALSSFGAVITPPRGGTADQLEPGSIGYPNVSVTVSEEMSQPLWTWHEDFVINGNNDDSREKSGAIEYRDASGKKVLLSVGLSHVGIFDIAPDAAGAQGSKGAPVHAKLYVEQVSLQSSCRDCR